MAAVAADQNLLFGLLALQNGLINQGQLVAAFQAWTLEKVRPMADYLVDRGDLDADDRAAVEALVERHLKRHGGDAEKSLAALDLGTSSLDVLSDLGITTTLSHVDSGLNPTKDHDPDRPSPFTVGHPTSEGQRFRILRPHAQGGLGTVLVALDHELHREVALKRIQLSHQDNPESRARFLLEAEITGRLEHPGVVPVYGLGNDPEGRPYYAMRLVKGETLKAAIARYHQAEVPERDPAERALALRRLLGRFVAVCNAVAYAHSRGIIHRDLKPANILLGPFGETLVVDWGLAKVVGREASPLRVSDPTETTLRPALAGGSSMTQPGAAMGTPDYMAPEQAAGHSDAVGPASDLYSLGATLYCLLTGRAPFEDTDVLGALRKARLGEFPPPRTLNASIDPALEAICLKAMALRPQDRQPSPRELADEIEVWLASDYEKLEQAHRELSEAHRMLKDAQAHVMKAEKLASVGLLAHGVAHALNNPLAYAGNSITVMERDLAELCKLIALYKQAEQPLEESCPELLGRIRAAREERDIEDFAVRLPKLLVRTRDALQRIEQIVADLSAFARIDSSVGGEDTDLNAGIETSVNMVRIQAYKKQLRIVTDLAPLPPVRCHPAQINLVTMNLLTNAIDACSDGGTITIRSWAVNDGVQFEVVDDGCGMPPEIQEDIFLPFFSTKPMGQATGMGLAISLGIVKGHGGVIEVESAPDQGSRFLVRLPVESQPGQFSPRHGRTLHYFRNGDSTGPGDSGESTPV